VRPNNVRFEVRVFFPWVLKEKVYTYEVDARQARESLTPLPRSREIDHLASFEAQQKRESRYRLISQISTSIAAALFHACEEEDPVNGYSKEEK
jgi:hypothetical protein